MLIAVLSVNLHTKLDFPLYYQGYSQITGSIYGTITFVVDYELFYTQKKSFTLTNVSSQSWLREPVRTALKKLADGNRNFGENKAVVV